MERNLFNNCKFTEPIDYGTNSLQKGFYTTYQLKRHD